MASRFLGPASPRRSLLAAVAAMLLSVTGALAQERCEGTLCDLYYDHTPSPQQKQQGAPTQPGTAAAPRQPQAASAQPGDSLLGRLFGGAPQQPTSAAPPAKRPLVAVQGGGVIGMVHGDAPTRCTGTLCDLFYGGPPPEEPSAPPVPAATPAADEPAAEEAPTRGRRMRTVAPPDEQPSCASSARDPWQCYR